MNFKLTDLTPQLQAEVARLQSQAPVSGVIGPMHLGVTTENGQVKVAFVPVLETADMATREVTLVWGPCPADLRSVDYHDPRPIGSIAIEPDGTWYVWVQDQGYVQGPSKKPVALFQLPGEPEGSGDGRAKTTGFTPGGQWFEKGSNTPSAPPGSATADFPFGQIDDPSVPTVSQEIARIGGLLASNALDHETIEEAKLEFQVTLANLKLIDFYANNPPKPAAKKPVVP